MIILYSTGCPKCKVLVKKLDSKNINYTVETNIDKMFELDIKNVPILQVEDKLLDFTQAIEYINAV